MESNTIYTEDISEFIAVLKSQPCVWVSKEENTSGWSVFHNGLISFYGLSCTLIYSFNPNEIDSLCLKVLNNLEFVKVTIH